MPQTVSNWWNMDLRPRNKTQSSIIDHFSSREAVARETSTEHNMVTEEQGEVEGSHATLQEIKRGNEARSQKLDAKTAKINQSFYFGVENADRWDGFTYYGGRGVN